MGWVFWMIKFWAEFNILNIQSFESVEATTKEALMLCALITSTSTATLPSLPTFQFSPVHGDDMVLQQQPARAAVYGYTGAGGTAVTVTVTNTATMQSYSVHAALNTTRQAFGAGFESFASKANPWNVSLSTWKALLKPTTAGGDYSITATCIGCAHDTTATLQRATFGDVWHCSGQSNMWFPVKSTYSRNDTVAAIKAGKYNNVHLMAGNSGTPPNGFPSKQGAAGFNAPYGAKGGSNQWMTALQAFTDGTSSGLEGGNMSGFQFGASCWYTAQRLVELGVRTPIGLINTAIGGQRIEEYMDNTSIATCRNRTGGGAYDGNLFGQMIIPFIDMTIKGWLWYQGENNMPGLKGNGPANEGYSCSQRVLIEGWRKAWSAVPGTTDPDAPFGIVTLASSGSEGGPNMGGMRQAQTAGYGVLPAPTDKTMRNTFFAQAYDLDDQWGGPSWGRLACHHNNEGKPCIAGPTHQPCFLEWNCCPVGAGERIYNASTTAKTCNATRAKLCTAACAAAASTPEYMGGIHPRSKKPVGDRLGTAAFNTVYGGKGAYTGPTLSSCSLDATDGLIINFDTNSRLSGGAPLLLKKIKPAAFDTHFFNITLDIKGVPTLFAERGWEQVPSRFESENATFGGSTLYVQVNASNFCMEVANAHWNVTTNTPIQDGEWYCPEWAGGRGPSYIVNTSSRDTIHDYTGAYRGLDTGWIELDFIAHGEHAIKVDLRPLQGRTPTAVRYAWGTYDCCDLTDETLWVSHGCIAECPIYSNDGMFPANPFLAKIVDMKCECIAPQVCSA